MFSVQRKYLGDSIRSYYITLTSKAPDGSVNASGNFVTDLVPPINVDRNEYDIGLVSINYTSTLAPERPRQQEPEPKRRRIVQFAPLFPNYTAPTTTELKFEKGTGNFMDFITRVNDLLRRKNAKIALGVLPISDKTYSVTIHNSITDPKAFAFFSEELVNALNHKRVAYYMGQYMPSELVTDTEFDKIPVDQAFKITLKTLNYVNNRIIIAHQIESNFPYRVPDFKDFKELFNDVIKQLEKANFYCTITWDKHNRATLFITGQLNKSEDYVIFPKEFSESLGFRQTKFMKGSYLGETVFNANKLRSIQKNKYYMFRLASFYLMPIEMQEPHPVSLKNIILEVNKAIHEQSLLKTVEFKTANSQIFVEGMSPLTEIRLPDSVEDFLGLDRKTAFLQNKTFNIRNPDLLAEEEEPETPIEAVREAQVPPISSDVSRPKRVLVLADVVDNQYYANRYIPLLRDIPYGVPMNRSNSEVIYDAESVIYLPLNRSDIGSIRVWFLDETFKEIEFGKTETLVTLHMKSRDT